MNPVNVFECWWCGATEPKPGETGYRLTDLRTDVTVGLCGLDCLAALNDAAIAQGLGDTGILPIRPEQAS